MISVEKEKSKKESVCVVCVCVSSLCVQIIYKRDKTVFCLVHSDCTKIINTYYHQLPLVVGH